MTEDKRTIVSSLMATLQATSYFSDLQSLTYEEEDGKEIVVATYGNGTQKKVNVNLDSGVALIQDVLEGLTNDD